MITQFFLQSSQRNLSMRDLSSSLTFKLNSFRLMITAVICWSMKIKIVAIIAGTIAAGIVQIGFLSKNGINQPRSWRLVGMNSDGTCNFGVFKRKWASQADIRTIAISTAKSPRIVRTYEMRQWYCWWSVEKRENFDLLYRLLLERKRCVEILVDPYR